MNAVAVYVHTPFCPSKCGYCDFNSYAMDGKIIQRTTDAIRSEILNSPWKGVPAKTIFFGGGTPTFLSEAQLLSIFEAVLDVHPPIENCEITSEANPGTVDAAKFNAMRQAGFNRISLGAQSFVADDLIRLDRIHQVGDIERAVGAAREAGFDNINLDLMFALPGQSVAAWSKNLDRAFALQPEHLSLYCLTIEPNTKFYKLHHSGKLPLPEDDDQVQMYEMAMDRALAAGMAQYEISNFSLPGRECQHNLCYWRHEPYAGYGPGAVGCMDGQNIRSAPSGRVRYTNLKHPERYASAVESGEQIAFEHESLDDSTARTETIMLGLRLNEGLDVDGLALSPAALKGVLERGWLEQSGSQVRLTREGRHFCSEVALALI